MKELILSIALVLASANANAGFLLGYMVGSSGKSKPQEAGSQLVVSDHDTVSCYTGDGARCNSYACPGGRTSCSPEVFAFAAGYKVLHKRAVVVSGSHQYIVMEVSK